MPNPTKAAQHPSNLLQSLGLVLGDHNPPKTMAPLSFPPPARAALAYGLAARKVAARWLCSRSHVPGCLGTSPATRRASGNHRHTNLDEDKPGRSPPQVTAAYRRARSPDAAAESDFASTGGESRQFLLRVWMEGKW